ncbi:hypothetical protein AB0F46_21635 [Streptomyces sp. NPDC026665]|uniref:hypothetical protein n=1 Tax=Streptomyces sp. NPDC026665 TaxID=3154798 RepID=UPI0033EFFE4B
MTTPTTKEWLRAAVDRVALGSTRLITHHAGRALRSVTTRVGKWPWWAQLGLAALALRGGLPAMTALGGWAHRKLSAGGAWLFIAAALWLLAAYRAGHPDLQTEPGEHTEPDGESAGEATDQEQSDVEEPTAPGPLLPNLLDLRIALVRVGTPHAHVAALAAEIGTTPERVREALDQWGIPVEAVRQQGRGTSTGVKGGPGVHPALAPGSDIDDVVAAGQTANNDNNNADGTPSQKGVRVKAIGLGGRSVHEATAAVDD